MSIGKDPKGQCYGDLNFGHLHKLIKGDVQLQPGTMNFLKSIRLANGLRRVEVHLSI